MDDEACLMNIIDKLEASLNRSIDWIAEASSLLIDVQPQEEQHPSWYERRDKLLEGG